mmetsp:Transcript_13418/g.52538  ORF Transcript_13418/g.52538 Transcript_13418/m.52538 type:complete len:585 (+) Transcript_13418:797-2551(+)
MRGRSGDATLVYGVSGVSREPRVVGPGVVGFVRGGRRRSRRPGRPHAFPALSSHVDPRRAVRSVAAPRLAPRDVRAKIRDVGVVSPRRGVERRGEYRRRRRSLLGHPRMDRRRSGMAAVVNRRLVVRRAVAAVVRRARDRGPSVPIRGVVLDGGIADERERNLHAERAPHPSLAADVDLAAVLTDDELRQRKADAAVGAVQGALPSPLAAAVGREYVPLVPRQDARARVGDFDGEGDETHVRVLGLVVVRVRVATLTSSTRPSVWRTPPVGRRRVGVVVSIGVVGAPVRTSPVTSTPRARRRVILDADSLGGRHGDAHGAARGGVPNPVGHEVHEHLPQPLLVAKLPRPQRLPHPPQLRLRLRRRLEREVQKRKSAAVGAVGADMGAVSRANLRHPRLLHRLPRCADEIEPARRHRYLTREDVLVKVQGVVEHVVDRSSRHLHRANVRGVSFRTAEIVSVHVALVTGPASDAMTDASISAFPPAARHRPAGRSRVAVAVLQRSRRGRLSRAPAPAAQNLQPREHHLQRNPALVRQVREEPAHRGRIRVLSAPAAPRRVRHEGRHARLHHAHRRERSKRLRVGGT